jgi:hypothetical protein
MLFRIIDRHNFLRKTKVNNILWRRKAVFYKKLIAWLVFIGLALISISLASEATFYTEVTGSGRYYNLNLLFSLGLAILFVALICFQVMRVDRQIFFERGEDLRNSESWQKEIEGIIEIDDEAVRTSYGNLEQIIKWPMFSNYMLEDDILFLSISKHNQYILTIAKDQMDDETFDLLFTLVKDKIHKKK